VRASVPAARRFVSTGRHVMTSIGGHDIRFAQGQANMVEMGASCVELQIEGAPGVVVELERNDALFPTVGVIQRLENQVTRLPDEVVKRGVSWRKRVWSTGTQ
jgi:hypothetical protein